MPTTVVKAGEVPRSEAEAIGNREGRTDLL